MRHVISRYFVVNRKLWLKGLAVALFVFCSPHNAVSQGCPPSTLMSPSFVCLSGSYLEPREWLMTVSYRRYHAFRDYQGDRDLPVPSPPEIYADTHVNIVDFMVTRALTSRFSVSLEMPFEWASRATYLEHDGVSLHTMRSRGFGDARIFGNVWVLDPVKNSHQNVSLKVGLKTPSGARAVKDNSFRETGPVLRPVDPAIQPATGGWGVVLGAQG